MLIYPTSAILQSDTFTDIFIQAEPKACVDLPKTDYPLASASITPPSTQVLLPLSPTPLNLKPFSLRHGSEVEQSSRAKESSPSQPPAPVQVVLTRIPDEAGASVNHIAFV
jgi:hypothetical protein